MKTVPTPVRLFSTFFLISALTLGGGYAMIPVFADRLLKKGWMEEGEFYDLFAVGQSFPGPMALNTAVLVGQRLSGIAGALAAFFGIMLPPFGSILLVAICMDRFSENRIVVGFLNGSYGVVIGLVAGLLYKMSKKIRWSIIGLVVVFIGAAALVLLKGQALWLYMGIALIAYWISK